MYINKLGMAISKARALEDSYAKQAQIRADVDFIALMADVELESDTTDGMSEDAEEVEA